MSGDGWQTRAYMALRPALQSVMRRALRRRLRRGKEDPARIGEKLGQANLPRPPGRLFWFHAVGLGEVMALRPLIQAIQAEAPGVNVLLTSSARSSARVIGANLPPLTRHQFLPLDGPDFVGAFLDHWRPDLSVWSEQDLWPGAICDTAARGIPLAYVNARMNAQSHRRRARLGGLYRDLLRRFRLVAAQDAASAAHLRALGAVAPVVTGSLKPAAAPLGADPVQLAGLTAALAGRRVWVAASTHPADEALVIEAQRRIRAEDPSALLILTPRLPDRAPEIARALDAAGLPHALRSRDGVPGAGAAVLLADSFGELGLWYRLARAAFIGGSCGEGAAATGGHNPWEAVCLGLGVISGPDTANFGADYRDLAEAGLVRQIPLGPEAPAALARAVSDAFARVEPAPGAAPGTAARALVEGARAALIPLARELIALSGGKP
ncbi:3-deoxy-D-manno-octulosonic acid transferase [Pseudogemmobacter sonorensis]|uniref:3-deoxy-D-manno-octulosonic acid transferase n=1 Tax=Pseudogemmobacter sonorensis TaxID=2989681 RepID=UPI0036C0BF40